MAEIHNSKRTLLQATYSPIVAPPASLEPQYRAFEKWHYVAATRSLLRNVLGDVRQRIELRAREDEEEGPFRTALLDLEALRPLIEPPVTPDPVASARAIRDIPATSLQIIGETGAAVAKEHAERLLAAHREMLGAFAKAQAEPERSAVLADTADVRQSGDMAPNASEAEVGRSKDSISPIGLERQDGEADRRQRPLGSRPPQLAEVALWAARSGVCASEAKALLAVAAQFETGASPLALQTVLAAQVQEFETLNEGFRRRMQVEPIGWLHLERLSFTPAGLERGELVQSVPLGPGEKVNISHREWSNTSRELQDIVTDYQENFSEQGVTEKSELADSTSNQDQHSTSFNTSHTVSGGFGPFINVSSSLNHSVQDSATSSAQSSQKHSKDLTSKASSRSKKEHKISFRVASASGTEDQAVKKIRNYNFFKPMRLDYYRLMRKWRVDLERYGVRMTYDLTVPEPGSDLMGPYLEMQDLEGKLSQEFVFPVDPSELTPENVGTYEKRYNAVVTPLPKDPISVSDHKEKSWDNTGVAKNTHAHTALEFDLDPRYGVTQIVIDATFRIWSKGDPQGTPEDDVQCPVFRIESIGFDGCTMEKEESLPALRYDKVQQPPILDVATVSRRLTYKVTGLNSRGAIVFFHSQVQALSVAATVTATLRDEVRTEWQMAAWNTLREAAETAHKLAQQRYQDRLDGLRARLASYDALTLRKMEREEVMKGVLRWLFGPEFRFYPTVPVVPPYIPPAAFPTPADWSAYEAGRQALAAAGGAVLDPKGGVSYYTGEQTVVSDLVRQQVLSFGEFIKFLQNAVEWENVLFVLYPYFWTNPSEWQRRLYLRHSDRTHELFLRAGAARVVLPIRPGYEGDFLSLMESADVNFLKDKSDNPYTSIAQEMQNYAKTNFAGLPSINKPSHGEAWRQIQVFSEALEGFYRDCSRYPTTKEGLKALTVRPNGLSGWAGPYLEEIPFDPWGHEYQYKTPGAHGAFDIVCLGETGQVGQHGELPDDAVVSWAEGSLIATWFEYTPTSALDIAIGEPVLASHEER